MGIRMGKNAATVLVPLLLMASCIITAKSASVVNADFWELKASMPTERTSFGVAVVRGKVYAIGGSSSSPFLSTNEMYDPAIDTWAEKKVMPTPRYHCAVATYENRIYVFGGVTYNPTDGKILVTPANEVYDPSSDTWATKTSMTIPRSGMDAHCVGGKIYVIGGRSADRSVTGVNEVYDPNIDSWTNKTSIPTPVTSYVSAAVGNKIYVIGGSDVDSKIVDLTQIYDVETDTWSDGAYIPYAITSAAAGATTGALAPERIYVVGGYYSTGTINLNQVYDPEKDIWSLGAKLPKARSSLEVAVVDDVLYAIGGTVAAGGISIYTYGDNQQYTPMGYGKKPPTIQIIMSENRTYASGNVSFVFTVDKPTGWLGYSLDGQETVTITGNITLTGIASGLHNITFYAKDTLGNMGNSTMIFTIDEESSLPEPFPIATVIAIAVAVVIVGIGLLVYLRKKH
ncbi:MAG: hypothetical protein NWE94_00160 [Candidatus Bathyarchaeota archaeon]|nr:hypothetical protein [Candidatus Bathyarchaeota archaeon]